MCERALRDSSERGVAWRCTCVGHTNNVHCLAKAVNALAGALFTVHGPGDVEMRLKEFLAVSHILIICSTETHSDGICFFAIIKLLYSNWMQQLCAQLRLHWTVLRDAL